MLKEGDEDILNCASCGYNSCEQMAAAIFNGLNKAENCHFYMHKGMEKEREIILRMNRSINDKIGNVKGHIVAINSSVSHVNSSVDSQADYLGKSVEMIEGMVRLLNEVSELSRNKKSIVQTLVEVARSGETDMKETEKSISQISRAVSDINVMMELIDDVAALTLKNITAITDKTGSQSNKTGEVIGQLAGDIRNIADLLNEVIQRLDYMSEGSIEIVDVINRLKEKNTTVLDSSRDIHSTVGVLTAEMNSLFAVTEENRRELEKLS